MYPSTSRKFRKPLRVKGVDSDEIRKFQSKAKEDAEKTDMVYCDTDALNLTAQYIAPMKESESKNRKCLFLLGELGTVPITEKCKDYVRRDPTNPSALRIIPKYSRNTPRIWPNIDKIHPLSEEDSIYLTSYGYYVISVPSSLHRSVNPGEFVTLTDVSFEVFVTRDLPAGIKVSDLSDAQKQWEEKDLLGKEVVFFFRAKSFKSLSKIDAVSQECMLKLYEDRGLITRWIQPYDAEEERSKKEQANIENHINNDNNDNAEKSDEKSLATINNDPSVKFHNQYSYMYEPKRVDYIPFDASSKVEDDVDLYPSPSSQGKCLVAFVSWPVSDRFISEKDKKDKTNYEAIKSKEETSVMMKAWSFTLSAWQRLYGPPSKSTLLKEGKTIDDYKDTDGINLESPIRDELVSVKVSMYNNTIEREFGIKNKDTWTHFISVYGAFFKGFLQCNIDAKRTLKRMERLNNIVAEHSSMTSSSKGNNSIAERNYDIAVEYRCDGILFNMREWIKNIGIPISNEKALDLLPIMDKRRNNPSVNDIKDLKTFGKHAVACLNEIKSVESCMEYIKNSDVKVYVVMMPGRLNATRMKIIEEISNPSVGDQLVDIVTIGKQKFTKGLHDPSIESLQKYLIEEIEESQFPLVFAICDIDPEFYSCELNTIAKFIGVSDPKTLREYFYDDNVTQDDQDVTGDSMLDDGSKNNDQDKKNDHKEKIPSEHNIIEEENPSQVILGSMEDNDVEIEGDDNYYDSKEYKENDSEYDSSNNKRKRSVNFDKDTKKESTGGGKYKKSSSRSRHGSSRRR